MADGEVNKKQAVADYMAANAGAKPKDVVSALKEKGIEVSLATVYLVRSEGKAAAKKGAKKESAKKGPKAKAPEAASGKVNKTQAVKDYKAQNPDAMPKQISEALKSQGIDVSPGYVSGILFHMKAKRGVAPKAPGRKPAAKGTAISLDALLAAKKLAERLGGVQAASEALAALAQLTAES